MLKVIIPQLNTSVTIEDSFIFTPNAQSEDHYGPQALRPIFMPKNDSYLIKVDTINFRNLLQNYPS